MAKQPETIFKERVLADLKLLPNTYAVKIQQVAILGTPDILACINGWFVALELKRDDKSKPDPRQKYELDKIDSANGVALVAHPLNWPGILASLKRIAAVGSPTGRKVC